MARTNVSTYRFISWMILHYPLFRSLLRNEHIIKLLFIVQINVSAYVSGSFSLLHTNKRNIPHIIRMWGATWWKTPEMPVTLK